ncbi:MAG: adenosylcobinamide-phosphate synthase CbiB [Paracoccaceae bacterium]
MTHIEMLVIALVLDALLGEPAVLWRRIPHPVVLFGQAVDRLDASLNRGRARRAKGVLAVLLVVFSVLLAGGILAWLPDFGIIEIVGAAVLLSHRSLTDHVGAVASGLAEGIERGRVAVAAIVGRDPEALDASGVARAAIESAAENFSDGVVAPALWFLLLGLPGILAYKAVNTMDSMIGHRSERYLEFGWAAARLDDALNWIPARLAGGLIAVSARSADAFECMRYDADLHRSPNAGWPEAAMAGALNVALSGPRSYDGQVVEEPYVNGSARRVLRAGDIREAVRLLWRSWAVLTGVLLVPAVLAHFFL